MFKERQTLVHTIREMKIEWRSSLGPCIGLVLVFLLMCLVAPSQFHSAYNIKTIITQTVITGIGALGMTFVIISGGIDLSIGSLIALGTVIIATVLNMSGGEPGFWLPVCAVLAAVAACALCGCISGAISAGLKIVPFIVTLGMMQIARGIAKWIAKEQTVVTSDNWLHYLMDVDPEPSWLFFAPGVWLLIFLGILVIIILRYTIFGRYVFALGSNEVTARLCGINVTLQRIVIYTVCGAFAGIAGIMQFANLTVGDPTAAVGMELDIIAAVVIGGGSLNGGEGSALGTLNGALIMAVLRNGCNLVGIPNYIQNIVIGTVIIGAVSVDCLKHTEYRRFGIRTLRSLFRRSG
jgi:ribose/xylose/arabinose/galactoside ABC-type transport system permease subunit